MNDTNGHVENGANGTNGIANGINGAPRSAKMLWRHPAPMSTPMFRFLEHVNQKYGLQLTSYEELHKWSTDHIAKFWGRVWSFVGIRAENQASRARTPPSAPL